MKGTVKLTGGALDAYRASFGTLRTAASNGQSAVAVAAGKLDEAAETFVDAAKAAPDVEKVKVIAASLPETVVQNLAVSATRNPNANRVVLGKSFEDGVSYSRVAAHFDATYFKISKWRTVRTAYSREDIWRINEAFLDEQIKAGKEIILSHNPATASGIFQREVRYLESLGFTFVQDGWIWKVVK